MSDPLQEQAQAIADQARDAQSAPVEAAGAPLSPPVPKAGRAKRASKAAVPQASKATRGPRLAMHPAAAQQIQAVAADLGLTPAIVRGIVQSAVDAFIQSSSVRGLVQTHFSNRFNAAPPQAGAPAPLPQ